MQQGAATQEQWFGHPRGLSTLFFTELWERFSYYGMRGLLILFMVAAVEEGGMGYGEAKAAAIYGLYTAFVYLSALPGGWIADRLIGQRKAVLVGGIFIAAGHFTMAFPSTTTFFLGLVLIVIGTGLLKPNVSAVVGDLYPEGGARRDAGFSVYYMGINLGAFSGPIVCGLLGENVDWHLGFSAAGIGMVLGLIQYTLGGKYLGDAGELRIDPVRDRRAQDWRAFFLGTGLVVGLSLLLAFLATSGTINLTLERFARGTGVGILALVILYFVYVLGFGPYTTVEKKRIFVIFLLFLGAAMFWSGFEQAGSSMNLFASDLTDRMIFGWEAPASWLQSVNPLFIILLSPVFGWLWLQLGSRQPSIPAKFGYGLAQLGIGFLVMAWASVYTVEGKVSPVWLIVTYFFHTTGELCLSPVGLSSITKLSPRQLVGQMMGIWFMGSALGNLLAGLAAGYIETKPLPELFGTVAMISLVSGFLFLAFSFPIRKLIGKL